MCKFTDFKVGNIIYDKYNKLYGIVSDIFDKTVFVMYYKDTDTLKMTDEYGFDFDDEDFNYGEDFDIEFFAESLSDAFPEYAKKHKSKYNKEHPSNATYGEDEFICPHCKANWDKYEFDELSNYRNYGYGSMYYRNGIFTCPICGSKIEIEATNVLSIHAKIVN